MNSKTSIILKYWKTGLSLIFGIIVYLFWAYPFVSVISFQEQFQLFLFGGDYFAERISVPGGLADYIAEFLTQFYYVPSFGATILAVLFVIIQRLTWLLCRRNGTDDSWYPLTFIPAVALWYMMSDENVMLSFVIALIAAMSLMLAYHKINKVSESAKLWMRMICIVIGFPLFYWLFGPCILMTIFYLCIYELKKQCSLSEIGFTVGCLVFATAIISIFSRFVPYEFHRFLVGINYYRYPIYSVTEQTCVMGLFTLLPFITSLLPKITKQIWKVCELVAVAGISSILIASAFNNQVYDLIEYDFYVRTSQWSKIIAKAEKENADGEIKPQSPMAVACVNLALSETGQLPERLFEFYQNGGEGLFPTFAREMTSPVPTGETFFRLGMINEAERYMYEAQEAIPNYRKSGRLTKRIAQCEIVNGQYEVAAKYLRQLSRTMFYSKWADATLKQIRSREAVANDPFYARLRSLRQKKTDFLYSDSEMDQMLGLLFVGNMKNKMAFEYLTCYVLLQGDLEKFMRYYPLGQYVSYSRIPRAFQEVLIGMWLRKNSDPKTIPYSVDAMTVDNTIEFIRKYQTNPKDPSLSQLPYSTNAWYYLVGGRTEKKEEKREMKEIY